MTKKKPRWRIEVTQTSEEDVPTRWGRFWGRIGNPLAWHAAYYDIGEEFGYYDYVYGHTREDALAAARARIEQIEAKSALARESREVFYVEGS